jgi:hypothetical protein
MFSAKSLSPEQIAAIRQWVEEGATMPDLQRRLKEDFSFGLTYMETRLLALDLGLEIKTPEKPAEPKPPEPLAPPANANPPGKVTVTMDTLALPGALISGRVTFSDGETAIWMLDEAGRPGLDPDTPGYRPTAEDITAFQIQLRDLVARSRGL